ncbi:TPA: Tn3 family transposase [Yersinia enterocolitica]|nr:Tn3 family transposase [Yersinia enterocolitica]HDL8557574.1 Tn3 family transposase [Yersinia enterocolitica]
MPVDFLTTEQTESYGRFTGEPDELQLARYFHLDEADKEFIGKSRGDHNRLGIALQIGCVRFLGTFLTDMNHIPSGVRHFTARQLGIRDITVLAEYGQRENTRREHAALIRQHYQYREFAWPWTFRLTRLLYTRSWISNERPGLLFDLATGWLMQHRIILPGATTLTRLISEVREKATLRLWNKLALIPSAEQRSQLEMLLGPTDCSRLSLLESLKKGPVTISGPAFNEAIERWKTLNDFGLHADNLSTLPAVRLKNLARYAGMTSVFNIARMSPQKRMAVLVAFVLAWETLALDDALDVLDAMLAVIIRDARKIGQKKRLRSLKDLDKSALALASACSYLLKEETPDESIRAEVFSYIPRQKLAEIITLVREIARPSDDNFHEEMVEQYGRVRRFLPHLLNTVKFSSAPAGVTTLNACDYLSREFSSRRQFFDDAPTEIISRSWKRLVINKEKHITRRGPNRKYFGNNRGITWYNFVSDQYSGFHGIVIPGTLRDSIFVLEGLLEQETGLNPTEIMTDTAGTSELVFGLFWLLGYQFSPRLADAGASVFWRMGHDANYGVLNDIARGQSDPRKIVLQWDEMIRTAGSLKLGKVQASVLVRSLLKSERPSGLTQAIIEVGRINKTLYLLNYIDDEDYRRRILTQLNRGESRHAVARAICHGQKGEIRKRYTDGQEDQLGALGLVTNAVVLWNTMYMQAALDHLRAQGETLNDEDIARLSPLCHGHINMLGHYSFTLAELVTKGHLRPLKEASEVENVA